MLFIKIDCLQPFLCFLSVPLTVKRDLCQQWCTQYKKLFGSDILSLYPQPKPKPLSFESLPQVLQLCGPSDVSSVNVSSIFTGLKIFFTETTTFVWTSIFFV